MKIVSVLLAAAMAGLLLFAGPGLAKKPPAGEPFKDYAAERAFPHGDPATNNINKCIWDKELALYICRYDQLPPR